MEPLTAGWMVASAAIKAYGGEYFGDDNVAVVVTSEIMDSQINEGRNQEILERISQIEDGLERLQESIDAVRGGPYKSGLIDLVSAVHTESPEREESIGFARQSFMAAAGQETPVRAVDSLAFVAICDLLLGRNNHSFNIFERSYELSHTNAREMQKSRDKLYEKKRGINTKDTLRVILFDLPNPRLEKYNRIESEIAQLENDMKNIYSRMKELNEIIAVRDSPFIKKYDLTKFEKENPFYWDFIPDEVLIERGWMNPASDTEYSSSSDSYSGYDSGPERTPEEIIYDAYWAM